MQMLLMSKPWKLPFLWLAYEWIDWKLGLHQAHIAKQSIWTSSLTKPCILIIFWIFFEGVGIVEKLRPFGQQGFIVFIG